MFFSHSHEANLPTSFIGHMAVQLLEIRLFRVWEMQGMSLRGQKCCLPWLAPVASCQQWWETVAKQTTGRRGSRCRDGCIYGTRSLCLLNSTLHAYFHSTIFTPAQLRTATHTHTHTSFQAALRTVSVVQL